MLFHSELRRKRYLHVRFVIITIDDLNKSTPSYNKNVNNFNRIKYDKKANSSLEHILLVLF